MFFVFFIGLAINQDIVEVYRVELVEVVIERVINKPLEGSQGPSEPEQHNQGFEQSKAGKECSQLFVSFFHSYVIEYRDDVDLREVLHTLQVVQGFLNQQQQVAVLYRDFVKYSIIHIESEASSWFLYKQDRRGNRGGTQSDKSFPEVLVELVAQRLKFFTGHGIDLSKRQFLIGVQADLIVIRVVRQQLICFLQGKDIGVVLKDYRELEFQFVSFLLQRLVEVFKCNYANSVASSYVGSYSIHTDRSDIVVVQIRDVTFRHFSESFLSDRVSSLVIVLNVVGIIKLL